MKYLVTGGAGFIGTNLVKRLLEEGHNVRVLDNYYVGKREERIQNDAEYMDGDIRNLEDLTRAMKGIDNAFHLAAVPRVPYSIENPRETDDVNATGTLNTLIAANKSGVKRVVFSSSSSVYGGSKEGISLKEDAPVRPISPYGLQKYVSEGYCRIFSELYGIETVSLRYFNVYGPYMDPDGAYALVIGKFLKQKKAGQPMTVCGDGEYFRDYTNVDDVARANILAMTSGKVGKGEVINIGFGKPYSVNELVKIIGGKYIFIDHRLGDPRWTKADNSKAKDLLSWEPKIGLEEGIDLLREEL
jgi:nucleoside-diphosphate-sugar epimerase